MKPRAATPRQPPAQRGSAILVALLVVAFVAVLAARLLATQERWSREVKLEGDRLQAVALADAAIDYGRAVLADDERRGGLDHRQEGWAQPLPPMSVEGGVLQGAIEDMQGRVDLNAAGYDGRALGGLWSALDLPPASLEALADWIDADDEARLAGGAEDPYYLGMARPQRAANTRLAAVDELVAVRGFDRGLAARLAPHVAALPASAPLNVNTASAETLQAIAPGLGRERALQLRRSGDATPFESVADFAGRLRGLGWEGSGVPPLAVASRWFMVHGEVRWGEAGVRMQAVVERTGGGAMPRLVWKRSE